MGSRRAASTFVLGCFACLGAAASTTACSSETASAVPPPAPAGASGPATANPAIHFVAEGKDVSSVYLTDPVSVRIDGLVPGSAVRVSATMKPWAAEATFLAAPDGTVDTARDAPTEGAYAGIDADGLFWSMTSAAFEYAESADVAFSVTDASAAPVTRTLRRETSVEGMRTVVPDDTSIVGRLFVPPGAGRRPAILAFGGSEGGLSGGQAYASELVPRGYVVLAIAYFAEKGVPADLESIPLEYFDKALAWLATQPDVDPARMGVIGGSRGGELSLLLASLHPELKAAVADAPSGYRWGAVSGRGPAWTKAGAPLGYMTARPGSETYVTAPSGEDALVLTPAFEKAVATSTAAEREGARTRVEDSGAAIAMFGGSDDQLWPACKLAQVAMDRLVETGHAATHGDELTCFEGAGHLLDAVGLPTTWTGFSRGSGGSMLALGGAPAATARAGRARQQKLRAFLARSLGAP